MTKKLITLSEYREKIPVCYKTALRHCQSKKIPARKIGGKWYVDSDFLQKNNV
jgi:hypothetical protein